MSDEAIIEIISPRGKVMRLVDTKPELVSPPYFEFITNLRCKAIKSWMEMERMVADEGICSSIQER